MKKNSNKILIITNSDAGLFKFRKELLKELLHQNKQVYVAVPEGIFRKELEQMGCYYIPVSMSRHGLNPFAELSLIFRYIRMIRSVSPEAVLTYTIKPNIYGNFACRLLKIPSAANITGLGTAVEKKGILQLITVFLYKVAFCRVSCVFFQNQQNLEFFQSRNMFKGPMVLLPGSGVNLEDFTYLDYPEGPAREFLFEGRIMKEKGIEQFLDAAKYIRAEYAQTKFTIIGTFEEAGYEPVIKELQEKGIVNFEGAKADVRPYLARCCCVLHPTYYPEGISNVLLEAAASGRPVITTGRSGCRETVEDGFTGFLVRERDSAQLIEKIEIFIKMPAAARREMGIRAREKIKREFDRTVVIKQYSEVLRRITADK